MAHRTSAAALHCARVILEKFDLRVKPPETLPSGAINGLLPTPAHVAIIIDRTTNVFEVTKHRPEIWYWQAELAARNASPGQIAGYLKRILKAFEAIPLDNPKEAEAIEALTGLTLPTDKLPSKSWNKIRLNKYSREAARVICYYYVVNYRTPRHLPDKLAHIEIAKLIEVSSGLRRGLLAVPLIRQTLNGMLANALTVDDVGEAFMRLNALFEAFPEFEERQDELKLLV